MYGGRGAISGPMYINTYYIINSVIFLTEEVL